MKKIIAIFSSLLAVFLFVTVVKAANGFDQYGYNYTARLFNGTGSSWSLAKGLPANYLGIYAPDKLVMKWNAEWDRGNAENWANPPYAAWEDNEWNGLGKTGGSGEVWHYKIVWVGPTKWDVTGQWNLDFNFGGDYPHTMTIDSYDYSTGSFSGTGFYNCRPIIYMDSYWNN